ncbi:hypothetical protein LBMAG46_14320 [Planctomycetia bacterium]|nr:hypothetical protein LBMAG46_14320 [Planctomycetia bacterium]
MTRRGVESRTAMNVVSLLAGLLGLVLLAGAWTGQPPQGTVGKPADPPKNGSAAKDPQTLRNEQIAVSGRYARFERMLMQMADILGRQDPERADLLRKTLGKGREDQVREDLEKAIALLESGELGAASEKQTELLQSFQSLMKLLQSEDRRSAVERERERLNGLLKDLRNVIGEQRSARAATQNEESPSNAAPGQQKALEGTGKLLDEMQQHDQKSEGEKSEGEKSEGEKSEGEKSEGEKSEGEKSEGEKSEGEKSEGEKSGGQKSGGQKSGGQKSGGQKSGGQKSGGQKSGGQKGQQQTPGRESLQEAEKRMQQALEALQQQQREQALKEEDAAIEELQEAAEKLEEQLKQLREEEKEMMLASLEARFQRMLIVETQIHEGTTALAAVPQKDWLELSYGRCRELAQQQTELARECAQTVLLLREDGTSSAILLAAEDIQADMNSVAEWMQQSNVSELTISVQRDILESLKQLVETMQREMQQMQERQQQENQQQQQGQQQSPLVDLIAEIRMLRNLQLQVNRRTKRVDDLLEGASDSERATLLKQVSELAERQQKLFESAKDLEKQGRGGAGG